MEESQSGLIGDSVNDKTKRYRQALANYVDIAAQWLDVYGYGSQFISPDCPDSQWVYLDNMGILPTMI